MRIVLLPHRPSCIGCYRIVGCGCFLLSMIDDLRRMSPLIHKLAVSKLALGKRQHMMVGSFVVGSLGMMGMMGMMGTIIV